MRLRVFTAEGIAAFQDALMLAQEWPRQTWPASAFRTDGFSSELPVNVQVDESKQFASRLDLARYLEPIVYNSGVLDIESAHGLWSWLAAIYFDQICPVRPDGDRVVLDLSRYLFNAGVPGRNFRRSSRHLIFGPVYVVHVNPHDFPMSLLCQAPSIHPDMAEQLASYQNLLALPAVMRAADRLYYDDKTRQVRLGATDRKRSGTVRRLIAVANQLDRTYDLARLTPDDLLGLLPPEFKRWLSTK